MKQLKQLFAVTLLVMAFGIPVYADGEIDTPGYVPTPTPAAAPAPSQMDTSTVVAPEVYLATIDAIEAIFGALALY